jgi:hypothetical protein
LETQTHKVERRCYAPVNRMAATGMRRNEAKLKTIRECPTLHPETFRVISGRLKIRTPDITGYKRGRMTIIGFVCMADNEKLSCSQWAARCDCGMYELRTYKNFLRGFIQGRDDCCDNCYDATGPKHARTR